MAKSRQHSLFILGKINRLVRAALIVAILLLGVVPAVAQNEIGASPSPVVNVLVDRDGIYRITYEALLAAGINTSNIRAAKIGIFKNGAPVPIQVVSPTRFGPGGVIFFYGKALDTLYTRTNVYKLMFDSSTAARIAIDKTKPPRGTPPAYYFETLEVDRNLAYSMFASNGDPWYDTFMYVETAPQTWDFPFELNGYIPDAPATVSANLWGFSDATYNGPDHHAVASVNGVPLGEAWWVNPGAATISGQIPDGSLANGANSLQVTLPADASAYYDAIMFDKFTVTYPRQFLAQDGRLTFTTNAPLLQVNGLPSKTAIVYRMAGDGVSRMTNVVYAGSTGDYSIKFSGSSAEATYVITVDEAVIAPGLTVAQPAANITSGPANYLMISHPDFLSGLGPLVQARQANGMAVKVVDVFEVYAQFSGGVIDPQAIKSYIQYAAANLGTQYVLLVGDDTYDYFNYLNLGSVSYIPTLYAQTDATAFFSPADPLYVDFDNNLVPELALGRLPVRTLGELEALINKTLEYDAKSYGGASMFSADQYYQNYSNNFIAKLPPGWSVAKAHIDEVGVSQARQTVLDSMNSGIALASYVGHSSETEWTAQGLFTSSDAAALINNDKPMVVLQFGCMNSYFVDPSLPTLDNNFLLTGMQGAAAVMGSTTVNYIGAQNYFGQRLIPRLTAPGQTIGQAMLEAKIDLNGFIMGLKEIQLGWTILGDPALKVQP